MKLITTPEACLVTGRTREVLYRWAREGRISRHGTRERRLWDYRELRVSEYKHECGGRCGACPPLPKPPKPLMKGGD